MPDHLRVAVITPYYREPLEMLRHCHDSVRTQFHPCTHFLIADGQPRPEVSSWSAQHFVLPRAHGDVGNTPRCLGSLSAMNQGYDAVAFLDADNWYYPNHVEAMVQLHQQTGAAVCTATRSMHRLDGSLLYVDRQESDGKEHVDTNCFFLTRQAFRVLPVWALMPPQLALIGDTIFWQALRARRLLVAHHSRPTVAYRTTFQVHYRNVGETPPPGTKSNEDTTGRSIRWWNSLSEQERAEWSDYLAPSSAGSTQRLTEQPSPVSSAAEENNRGVALLAQRQYVEAEAAFRRALLLDPQLPELSFNLAKALEGQQRSHEAEDLFRRHCGCVPAGRKRTTISASCFFRSAG